MRRPCVTLGLVLMLSMLPLGQKPVARQTSTKPAAASKPWTATRTPWGHPDLQGLWSNATTTPLERPAEFADKPFLSDEEFAAVNAESANKRNTDRAPRPGDPGTYNEVWWERGNLLKQTSIIVDPPNGRVPPLTPDGQKRAAAYAESRRGRGPADSWEDRNLHERCILYHGVPPLPTGYNNNYQIAQTPTQVVIRYEMLPETRVIPLDGRPNLSPRIRLWMGDSRGRWEGDTLVVDSTNFNHAAGGLYELGSLMHLQGTGKSLRVIERFTRVAPDMIDYTFTIDDRTMFMQAWTGKLPLTAFEGPIFEYACHEGNYAMEGVLRGARAQEAAALVKSPQR
jgi:hypothetical protein